MNITKAQIRKIKVLQRNSGLDDDIYRAKLKAMFNRTSCTKLSKTQASMLIRDLLGKPPARRKTKPARGKKTATVVGIISVAQRNKISALSHLVRWQYENGLALWCRKRFGFDSPRTDAQAWKVIEGLKNMIEHQMSERYGRGWKKNEFADPGITEYIRRHG